jgi:hypothetical protein
LWFTSTPLPRCRKISSTRTGNIMSNKTMCNCSEWRYAAMLLCSMVLQTSICSLRLRCCCPTASNKLCQRRPWLGSYLCLSAVLGCSINHRAAPAEHCGHTEFARCAAQNPGKQRCCSLS